MLEVMEEVVKSKEIQSQVSSLEKGKIKEVNEGISPNKTEILEPDIDAIKTRTLESVVEENRNACQQEVLNENSESKERNDTNECPKLWALNENEKVALKSIGLSDSNIEKCSIDENNKIYLNCRNQGLENNKHPETKILYVRKEITIQGIVIEGVFPQFEYIVSYELPETQITATEKSQFDYLNRQFYQEVLNNPKLREQFTEQQIEILSKGKNPPGFTWHHSEEYGKMQLVSTEIHSKSAHTGGDSIWCGR